jgi:hypothetical protein
LFQHISWIAGMSLGQTWPRSLAGINQEAEGKVFYSLHWRTDEE